MKKNVIKKLSLMSLLFLGVLTISSCGSKKNKESEEETVNMTESYKTAREDLNSFTNIEYPKLENVEIIKDGDNDDSYLSVFFQYNLNTALIINDYFNQLIGNDPEVNVQSSYTDIYWETTSTINDRKYDVCVGYYIENKNIELYGCRYPYYLNKIVTTTGGSVTITKDDVTFENNEAYLRTNVDYTATAVAEEGYAFDGFYINNQPQSLSSNALLYGAHEDVTIEARFVQGYMAPSYGSARATLFRKYNVIIPIKPYLYVTSGEGVDSTTQKYYYEAKIVGYEGDLSGDTYYNLYNVLVAQLGQCDSGYPSGEGFDKYINSRWTKNNYVFTCNWTAGDNQNIYIRVDHLK